MQPTAKVPGQKCVGIQCWKKQDGILDTSIVIHAWPCWQLTLVHVKNRDIYFTFDSKVNTVWNCRKDLSYPHKPHPSPGCRELKRCCLRSWCRGYRGPVGSPGPSMCPPRTPHTLCRAWTCSLTARHGLWDTWCRAHTAVTVCSGSSHTCTCTWRHWSRCMVYSWRTDLCMWCRADTCPCG